MATPRLLDEPVRRGVRRIAARLTHETARASLRLHDASDAEALHDFRVGLRRLRTVLRAYREHLDPPRRLMRDLRRLARRTNGPRDAEVGLEWISAVRADLGGRRRAGSAWMSRSLEADKRQAYERLRDEVPLRWVGLERRLRAWLADASADLGDARPFRVAAARAVGSACDELAARIAEVRSATDRAHVHAVRIRAKRLRYLLEPLRQSGVGARDAVREFKAFQDVLGELNDAHVMLERIRAAVRATAAERAERLMDLMLDEAADPARVRAAQRRREEPGLLALARMAVERRDARFARAQEAWFADGGAALLDPVRRAVRALAGDPGEPADDPGRPRARAGGSRPRP